MKSALFYFCSALLLSPVESYADTPDPISALKEISLAICGEIKDETVSEKFSVKGDAALALDGILDRLADVGLNGASEFSRETYIAGLKQSELRGELQSIRDCNFKVFQDFSPLVQEWISTSISNEKPISVTGDCTAVSVGTGNVSKANCDD